MPRSVAGTQVLLLCIVTASLIPAPSESSLSSDSDYSSVFSDGIRFPSDEARLYYTSGRKYQVTGDAKSAAGLYKRLASTPGQDPAVLAAALARLGQLSIEAQRAGEAADLISDALSVCTRGAAAGSGRMECGEGWVGWGMGSCCSIAAVAGKILRQAGRTSEGAAAMRLSRRLTPSYRSSLPPLLPRNGLEKKRVVLLFAASGRYNSFVEPLVASARRFFLAQHDVRFVAFTDDAAGLAYTAKEGITVVSRPELGWPLAAMMRYRHYSDNWHLLDGADYLFSIDVDCLFVAPVGEEVLVESVGTAHADNAYYDGSELRSPSEMMPASGQPKGTMWLQTELAKARSKGGFSPGDAVYERRNGSMAYIPHGQGVRYYYSGFYGGVAGEFRKMVETLARATEADIAKGMIARVHDESHINRYWLENPPATVLSFAYMYPEAAVLRDDFHRSLCRPKPFCPRDHMHPWVWDPWRPRDWDAAQGWTPRAFGGAVPLVAPRILNLAKDKQGLVHPLTGRAENPLRYVGWTPVDGGVAGRVARIARGLGMEMLSGASVDPVLVDWVFCIFSEGVSRLNDTVFDSYQGWDSGSSYPNATISRMCGWPPLPAAGGVGSINGGSASINRGIVVYLADRFDARGDGDAPMDQGTNRKLSQLMSEVASGEYTTIVASNDYNAAYFEYFTGVQPIVLPTPFTPPFRYSPSRHRPHILVDACDAARCTPPRLEAAQNLFEGLRRLAARSGVNIADISQLYPGGAALSHLAQHPAIVLIPTEVSSALFSECTAMGVPVFVPSPRLLAEWQAAHNLVRIWAQRGGGGSLLPPHPLARSEVSKFDPNDAENAAGASSWLARAEYYRHGAHMMLFDTLGDLARMLGGAVDLSRASATALRWHSEEERGAHSGWKEAIGRVVSGYEPGARGKAVPV